MATPKYDSMPEYREALSERARGLDGLLEPLRSEALQLLWAPVAEGAPASLGSYFDASEVEDVIESVDFFEELFEDIKKTNMVAKVLTVGTGQGPTVESLWCCSGLWRRNILQRTSN